MVSRLTYKHFDVQEPSAKAQFPLASELKKDSPTLYENIAADAAGIRVT